MLVFFTKLGLMEIQVRNLVLFLLGNRHLQVILDGMSSQDYPVDAGIPQGSILGPTRFLLMTFLMMLSVILLSMLMLQLCILNVIGHLISGGN